MQMSVAKSTSSIVHLTSNRSLWILIVTKWTQKPCAPHINSVANRQARSLQ